MEIAYLSSAAFDVGRRSRFDRRQLEPAPSTWRSTFRRLLEEESSAVPPFSLRLLRPTPCVFGLALCGAGGGLLHPWACLGEAGGNWRLSLAVPGRHSSAAPGGPSSAAPGRPSSAAPGGPSSAAPGGPSSAALDGPSRDCLSSSAAPGGPGCNRWSSPAAI
jgi:hypothetical protein